MLELGPSGDVRDAAVPEGVQVPQNGVGGVRVVDPDRGGGAVGGGVRADDDGRHAEVGEQGEPGVVATGVDHDHAVDTVSAPPVPVGLEFFLGITRDEQVHADVGAGEPELDAGDQVAEERLRAQGPGRAVQHEPDGTGLRAAECPGRGVWLPVELAGDLAHAATGLVGDTGAVVQRERHRADGHAGPRGDVGDRRSTLGGHGVDYSALVIHSGCHTRVR